MVKKKKEETIHDIMDRIQEDLDILRDKAQDLEDNQCQCDSDDDDESFDEDEDSEEDSE